MTSLRRRCRIALALVVGCAVPMLASLAAHGAAPPVDDVAFLPPAGAALPRAAAFTDEYGHRVRLSDYLAARPMLLVPAYYGCSNLCGTVLSGLAAALASSGLRAGRDVEVVVVSISPLDSAADALAKKRSVLGGDAAGWHFLTGDEPAIAGVTSALGYRYRYDGVERQYAHAAGVAVAATDGRVAGVLYGAGFRPAELRHAVTAASGADAPGPAIESDAQQWLLCFHYDPQTGRYAFAAMSAVRAAGLLTLLALTGYALRAWRRERRTNPRRRDCGR